LPLSTNQHPIPLFLVAGPSACGKTTAAKAAVQKASEFLQSLGQEPVPLIDYLLS